MSYKANTSLLKDMLLYALSKALPGLLSFIFIMFLIRVLGDEGYGAYALTISTVMASTAFASGWVKQSVIRYRSAFGEGKAAYDKIIRGAVLSSLGLFLILFSIVENIVLKPADINLITIAIAYISGIFVVIYGVRQGELQAAFSPKGVLYMEVIRTLTLALVSIGLLTVFGSHYELALFAFVCSYIVAMLITKKIKGEALSEKVVYSIPLVCRDSDNLLGWWRYGWPLSLWLGCILLMQVMDKMTIQYFYGLGVAGQYSSIYDLIVRGYGMFVYPVTLALHPRIMKSANTSNRKDSRSMIIFGILLQIGVFIPVLILSTFFSDVFLKFAIGKNTDVLVQLVVPLIFSAFLWQLAIIVHKSMEIAGRTRSMLAFAVLALFVNGVLNWILVPQLGAIGGAYSTISAAIVYILLTWYVGRYVWSDERNNLGSVA